MIFMLGGFHKEAARFRLVGQVGLEPTMVKPADLQSAAMAARRLTLILFDDANVRYRAETLQSPPMLVTDCLRQLAAGGARRTRI